MTLTRFTTTLLILLPLTGCALNGSSGSAADDPNAQAELETSADPQKIYATVEGTVSVAGTAPQRVVLVTPPGSAPVALIGEHAELLERLTGLEVVATGTRSGSLPAAAPAGAISLVLQQFTVRSADGVPAWDGVIEERNGAYFLRLADGSRVATPALPQPLRQRTGARVFLAGPLDRAPVRYGIIAEP